MLNITFALLLFSAPLLAQKINVELDPAKTEIHWTLPGNVHTTHGTFHLRRGHVAFDPATADITGEVVADATSGDSGNGARDKRMNKEILESAQYPDFRFTPEKAEGSLNKNAHSTIRVSGIFFIHGTSHNVTIPLDVSFTAGTLTGTGKFSIPYVDWGIKDPSNFLFKVEKSVEIELVAVGTVQAK